MNEALPRLMLVSDRHRARSEDLVASIVAAVRGGVGIVQIREKDLDDRSVEALVAELRSQLDAELPILVNGRGAVARRLDCGVHLPAGADVGEAEGVQLWGRSAHDVAEADRVGAERPDYAIVGTIYATSSKPSRPGSGPGLIEELAPHLEGTPVFAIGGIEPGRVGAVMEAGAWGVAVCTAILGAARPADAARELCEAIDRSLGRCGERDG